MVVLIKNCDLMHGKNQKEESCYISEFPAVSKFLDPYIIVVPLSEQEHCKDRRFEFCRVDEELRVADDDQKRDYNEDAYIPNNSI